MSITMDPEQPTTSTMLTSSGYLNPKIISEFLIVLNGSSCTPDNQTNGDRTQQRLPAHELYNLLIDRGLINQNNITTYFMTLVPDICKLLAKTNLEWQNDLFVIKAVEFLIFVMGTEHKNAFEDKDLLSYIFNDVILLHIQLRPFEISVLENNSEEWKSNAELNKSSFALRRQEMVTFVTFLGNYFPEKMRHIISCYCETMDVLACTKKSQEFNWNKIALIHLITDISRILNRTQSVVIGINDLVNVDSFCKRIIIPELRETRVVDKYRLMKVEMVRYLVTFMEFLAIDSLKAAFPDVMCFLFSNSEILLYYCSDAIRKLLAFLATRAPYTDFELQYIAEPIEEYNLEQNHSMNAALPQKVYRWTCYMIVLSYQSQLFLTEFISIKLPKVIRFIVSISKQKVRDLQCFIFFFRCLGTIIQTKRQVNNLAASELDGALIPVFMEVIQKNNPYIISYSFDMLTQLLKERVITDHTPYTSLIDLILDPTLWHRRSHAYSLSRLLGVCIETFPTLTTESSYLEAIVNKARNLISEKIKDHLAFIILNRIVTVVSVEVMTRTMNIILPYMSLRFRTGNTYKYANYTLTFFSIIIIRFTLPVFISIVNDAENCDFTHFLQWILAKATPLSLQIPSRKVCAMATSTIIGTPIYSFQGRCRRLFLPLFILSFNLINIPHTLLDPPVSIGENEEASTIYYDHQNIHLKSVYTFHKLHLAQSLRVVYLQHPNVVQKICQMPPDLFKNLLTYLGQYDCDLRDIIANAASGPSTDE